MTTPVKEHDTGNTVLLFEYLQVSPLSVANIHRCTDRDPFLSKVRPFVLQGWPMHLQGEEFRPLVRRKDKLSVNDHVLLWGSRVIVPLKVREKVIDMLHNTHPGVSHMKSLAQSYVWCPAWMQNRELCKELSCLSREFEFTSKGPCAPLGVA